MADMEVKKRKLIDWLKIRLQRNRHTIDGFTTWAKAQAGGTLGAWKSYLCTKGDPGLLRERMEQLSLVVHQYPIGGIFVVIASEEVITISAVLPKKGEVRVFHSKGRKPNDGFLLTELMSYKRWAQAMQEKERKALVERSAQPAQDSLFDT